MTLSVEMRERLIRFAAKLAGMTVQACSENRDTNERTYLLAKEGEDAFALCYLVVGPQRQRSAWPLSWLSRPVKRMEVRH